MPMLIVLDEGQLNAGSADVSSAKHAQHAHLFLKPNRPTLLALGLSADEPSAFPAMRYVKLKVDDPNPDS